jgi:hypothetical protein
MNIFSSLRFIFILKRPCCAPFLLETQTAMRCHITWQGRL